MENLFNSTDSLPVEIYKVVAISDPTPTASDRRKVFDREGAPNYKTITVSSPQSTVINGQQIVLEPRLIKFATWDEDLYAPETLQDTEGKDYPKAEWAWDALELGTNIIGYINTMYVEPFDIDGKAVTKVSHLIMPEKGKQSISKGRLLSESQRYLVYNKLTLKLDDTGASGLISIANETAEEQVETPAEPANDVAPETPAETPAGS